MGAKWLREWCNKAGGHSSTATAGDDTVALAVCRILLTSASADAAAAELFDFFGDTGIESIQELLENRQSFFPPPAPHASPPLLRPLSSGSPPPPC
jgi:hypothetical protein